MSIRIEIKEKEKQKRGHRKKETENTATVQYTWIEHIVKAIIEEIQKDKELAESFKKVVFYFSNSENIFETECGTIVISGEDALKNLMHRQVEAIAYYVFEYDIEDIPKDENTLVQHAKEAIDAYINLAEHYDKEIFHEIAISTRIMNGVVSMFGIRHDTYIVFKTIAKIAFEYACKNRDRIVVELKP